MKIVVIGKSGQLAWELKQLSSSENEVICLGRDDVDITDYVLLKKLLASYCADALINASAYTAVDAAESDCENAMVINSTAVGNLAKACAELSLYFVHISTDFVFQGDKGIPYLPSDEISPLGVYGETKAAGEQLIHRYNPLNSLVIRTSWVYSCHGNNFVKTMLDLMESKPELGIISDQIGTPTYAKGLAKVCILACENKAVGTHHYTDAGVASWYDFAVAIQEIAFDQGILTQRIPIKPIRTEDYPTPAKRPHYSVLDKTSLRNALPDVSIEHWQTQLKNMIKAL